MVLVHLLEAMTSDTFENKFSAVAVEMGCFLELVINVDLPAARSIDRIIMKMVDTCSKPLKKSIFSRSPNTVLEEMEAERIQ